MAEEHNHEHQDNIIILEDDSGSTIECEVIDVFDMEFKGNVVRYVAMMESGAADTEDAEVDVIVMKILKGETEEDDALVSVDDEDELQAAFDEFVKRDEEYNNSEE